MRRGAAEAKLISTQNMLRINEQRAARGAAPIRMPAEEEEQESSTSPSDKVDALPVEPTERAADTEDWGFIMFRTDYRDEALWERFLDEYDPILQEGMARAPAPASTAGVERVREKLYMKIVSDDCLANKGPAEVALAYRMLGEDDDLEPGLQTKMCLMVDEDCMRSVTERRPNTPPFVKAVDVTLGENQDLGYPGFFKVAISSLVTEFYPALARCEYTSQLRPSYNDIWQHAPDLGTAGNEWETIEGLIGGSSGTP